MTRSQIINRFIETYGYKTYLEIGVNTPAQPGYNWDSVRIATKHGVDPNPAVHATYCMTSDEFFANHITMKYDIIFIDGLHLFEQAHRDIVNALAHLAEGGTIVVHDCNPTEEKTQRREHTHGAWHGDVWRAILKLRMEDPDISIYTIDADEGCGVIQRGVQKLFVPPSPQADVYNFAFFDAHRKDILNLISVEQFKRIVRPASAREHPIKRAMRTVIGTKGIERLKRVRSTITRRHTQRSV